MTPTPADIALTLDLGSSPDLIVHLLELFGSAEAVYAASSGELIERAQVRQIIAYVLPQKKSHARAEQELRWAAGNGVQVITSLSPDYPALLLDCPDRPHVLYVRGEASALQAPMLAMVGTRKISSYGLWTAGKLVQELAALQSEAAIVSGLAFGVDVACHRAALAHGLRTIAVMATPIHQIYPTVHRDIAEEIIRSGGALVSELNSQAPVSKYTFLQRNRIVAGMSAGTLVVQSPDHGGSMVTASIADSYDRPLLAPPGPLNDAKSAGSNRLIRTMKARMVCSGSDIAQELGWASAPSGAGAKPTLPALKGVEKQVYDAVCKHPDLVAEELEFHTGVAMQPLLATLLELEFAGYIRSLPGNRYEKFG